MKWKLLNANIISKRYDYLSQTLFNKFDTSSIVFEIKNSLRDSETWMLRRTVDIIINNSRFVAKRPANE